jgi:hypothetical protein
MSGVMNRFVTAFVILCLALSGCAKQSEEANLRLRLGEYEKNWANQQYDDVWNMMSQSRRDETKSEQRQFIEFIRGSQATLTRLEIGEIRIQGEKATVQAKATIRSAVGTKTKQENQEQQWIKVNGVWLLDGYRSLP